MLRYAALGVTVVLAIAKLLGYVSSWWWVVAPLLFTYLIHVLVVLAVYYFIVWSTCRNETKWESEYKGMKARTLEVKKKDKYKWR